MPSNVGKYSGNSDPDDHLNVFMGAGGIEQWSMPVWCHMFAQTLTGPARLWFDSLPVGGIDSIEDFIRKFLQQFGQQRRHTKSTSELLHIRRKDTESVEDFMTRYNKESLQIGGAGEELLCAAFIQGVRSDELVRRIHGPEGLPKTLEGIMNAAKIFVEAERKISANKAFEQRLSSRDLGRNSERPSREAFRTDRFHHRLPSYRPKTDHRSDSN